MPDTLLPVALVEAASRVIAANRETGLRVAAAESCTGGLVGAALTEVSGSSDVFEASIVTYSYPAKEALLGVSMDALAGVGAVSPEVAHAMAIGAIERSGADVAVSITGVAGPGGGSAAKPVGTVYFSKARRGDNPADIKAERKQFEDTGRGGVRLQAALWALELLMPDAELSSDP